MTIAIRPLSVGRDGTVYSGGFYFRKSEYFFLWGWTAQITPDLARRARDFFVWPHPGIAMAMDNLTGRANWVATIEEDNGRPTVASVCIRDTTLPLTLPFMAPPKA